MSSTPTSSPVRTPWREVFGWRFWLNYDVCLLLTAWIPMVRVQVEIDGKPQGDPQYLPLYRVYLQVWENPDLWMPWKFVLIHLGVTFVVMALVWTLMLRRPLPAKAVVPATQESSEDHG